MALRDCTEELSKVIGRTISKDEAIRIMGMVEDRAKVREAERGFFSRQEQLQMAGKDLADQAKAVAAQEKRAALLNLQKRIARHQFYTDAPDPVLGLEAKMVGVNSTKEKWSSRWSVDTQGKALWRDYMKGMKYDLDQARLLDIATKGELDDQIMDELFELSRDGGKPGVTKNADALKIAQIFHKYQKLSVADLNREGAWVGAYAGYITRTMHDPDRIRRAGFDLWYNTIMPLLDKDRTFEGVDDEQKFMRGVYDALVTGVHLTQDGLTGFKDPAFKGHGNLAKRLSQDRTLHFRGSEAWRAYREKFGSKDTLLTDVTHSLEYAARATALMREFGTNPKAEFEDDIRRLEERLRSDHATTKKITKAKHMLANRYMTISGEDRMPTNRQAANINNRVRLWEGMAKLGGMVVNSFFDMGTKGLERRYQGQKFLTSMGLLDPLLGRGLRETTRRRVADVNGTALDAWIADMHGGRWDMTSDAPPGLMASMSNLFNRLTLQRMWDRGNRAGNEGGMARDMGYEHGKTWERIKPQQRRVLTMFGIGKEDWDLLQTIPWKQADNRNHLTADLPGKLSDEAVDARLADQVAEIRARPGQMRIKAAEMAAKEQTWIEKKIAKFIDRKDKAISRLALIHEARGERFAKNIEAIQARIDLMNARIEGAEAETDLLNALKGMTDQDTMRRFLQQAHDWKVGAFKLAGKSDRAVERSARRNLTAGEKLGERRAKAEGRIKDLETKARNLEAALVEKGDTETAALMDSLKGREEEVAAFIERVKERQQQRIEAAGQAESMVEPRLKTLRDNFRRDLSLRLLGYFADRGEHSVVTPGMRERSMMFRGTQPGNIKGELFRYGTQFKSFPVAMVTKVLGREIYGGQSKQSMVGGMAWLIASSAVLGYLSMSLSDISKGRTPRDPTDPATFFAAIARGGGFGIYGDYLFGEYNRFGRSALASIAGPVFSQIDDLMELKSRATRGDDTAGTLLRMIVSNTPFANLFYARMALDYLVLYNMQEWANPGYLARMQARIKQQNNQEFMFPPSTHAARY